MASMKVIDCIELDVLGDERHLKEMQDAAEVLCDDVTSIKTYVDPESPYSVIAEFTMAKKNQNDISDKIMHTFAESMPNYQNQWIAFPRSEAEERKAQKASERAKAKRKLAREQAKPDLHTMQIVFTGNKGKLTNSQRAFLNAKKEVERYQRTLREWTEKYEILLLYYSEIAAPTLQALCEVRKAFIEQAAGALFDRPRKPAKKLRGRLANFIFVHFAALAEAGYIMDESMSNLQKKTVDLLQDDMHGKKKNRNTSESGLSDDTDAFEALKETMQAFFFAETGETLDMDGLNSEMGEEEIMDYIHTKMFGHPANPDNRKKTDQQHKRDKGDQQTAEEHSKNLTSVYRQLARMFHPDLEQDPQLKVEKEAIMKELTAAYDKGDLYTILGLELRWLQKNDGDISKMTAAKLDTYTQALKQQCHDIQMEISSVKRNPRYARLAFIGTRDFLGTTTLKKRVRDEANELKQEEKAMRNSLVNFKNIVKMPDSSTRTRKLLAFIIEDYFDDDDDDFFFDLFDTL